MRPSIVVNLAVALLAVALVPAPRPARAAQTRAFTVNTDFQVGSLSVTDLDTRSVTQDVAVVGSDPAVRWFDGLLYVVNRFGGDNIQVLDPNQGYATLRQISVGNGTNPQDIVFVSPTKAYVSRYGSSDLLVMNPSHPAGIPQFAISLAAFADGDGLPEMAHMIRVDRWLFVACQRLAGFTPSNPSVVVVVDTQADTVVDVDPVAHGKQAILLTLRNPFTGFAFDRAGTRLLLGCVGALGALDGGIEAIDPIELRSAGVVITEQELGGDISDVVWHSPTKAYATTTFGFPGVGSLVRWNPATGANTGVLYGPGEFNLPDAELNDRGELYVCRQDFSNPGLLVFDASSDALLAGPLPTGPPPAALTFDQATDAVTGVPPAHPSVSLSAPWPNPARTGARLQLRTAATTRVRAEVVDAGGRVTRVLMDEARPAGTNEVYWNLTDREGRPVPAGLYFLRLRANDLLLARKIAVLR